MRMSPFDTTDELIDEFTSKDFSIIEDTANGVQEERKSNSFDYVDWNETIDSWYEEIYIENKKQKRASSTFGFNEMQGNFVFYNLYSLIGNEEKALKHVNLAFQFYRKNTLSYQWENTVYNAFRELYGHSVETDCVLPNNKRPDLVISPTYHEFKYHPRGSRIIRAEKIVDMKTNVYGVKKELISYKDYCEELIIVYLEEGKIKEHEGVTFISSDELIEMITFNQIIIENIRKIQAKIKFEFILNEFARRINITVV